MRHHIYLEAKISHLLKPYQHPDYNRAWSRARDSGDIQELIKLWHDHYEELDMAEYIPSYRMDYAQRMSTYMPGVDVLVQASKRPDDESFFIQSSWGGYDKLTSNDIPLLAFRDGKQVPVRKNPKL